MGVRAQALGAGGLGLNPASAILGKLLSLLKPRSLQLENGPRYPPASVTVRIDDTQEVPRTMPGTQRSPENTSNVCLSRSRIRKPV